MKRVVRFALSFILLFNMFSLQSIAVETPLLTFALMSDTHIASEKDENPSGKNLKRGMEDLRKQETSPDALIITGDLTDHGKVNQYEGFVKALSYAPQINIFTVMGNHDAGRHLTGGYEEAFENYKKYCGDYGVGHDSDVPYYDKWINDYHFIFLSTEDDLFDHAYISPEQLKWFEEKLAENASPYKPIFVISHQPLKETFSRTEQDSENIGPQNNQIKTLIEKYPQVVFLSGHTHNGFGYMPAYINEGKGSFVNVPPATGTNYGYKEGSVMYYVEVYSNEVMFRARDFWKDQWLPQYDFSIAFPRALAEAFSLVDDSSYQPYGSYIAGVMPCTEPADFMENFVYSDSLKYEPDSEYVGTGDIVYNVEVKKVLQQ